MLQCKNFWRSAVGARTSLYRHYDGDGRLLYVGISLCHLTRLGQHRSSSEWFWDIANITVEHFETREQAVAAEAEAVRLEVPKCNVRRAPLNVKPTLVRLTQSVLDRIEAVAGKNQRAAFIREAVDRELDRREAAQSDTDKPK
ncbi:hypothetical protein PhaeoP71_01865 [Phaeobacter piscinae]|nr:hypothetical protein PhaeoP71_01865 [Phaeobacter piscinae]